MKEISYEDLDYVLRLDNRMKARFLIYDLEVDAANLLLGILAYCDHADVFLKNRILDNVKAKESTHVYSL